MATASPELLLRSGDATKIIVDVLAIAVAGPVDALEIDARSLDVEVAGSLLSAARAVGYRAKPEAVVRLPAPPGVSASSVLLVGLGASTPGDLGLDHREALRRAAGAAVRTLDEAPSIALAFPVIDGEDAEAVATGALLGAYRYTDYRSATAGPVARSLTIVADQSVRSGLDRARVVAGAVAAARDLVNQPPSDLFPESFAQEILAQASAEDLRGPVSVEVLDDAQLQERGFGGLTGVGRGSARAPRLVKVMYTPAAAARHLALVGKGITFDSGGISLKPAAKMEKMKSDMAGAAAVVQALFAIARLGAAVRVTAWLALAENMPSGSALRPADVLSVYGGKTVEVTNTDAEGRLVLADALVAAQEESPDLLVDVATLTGAQIAALGYRTSGIMGTAAAREEVLRASSVVGESMWTMPIPEETIRYFDSETADLKNAGAPAAGMLAAAAFLREFVEDSTAWAHIDIAGPAYNADSPYGFTQRGGTGVPVRTIIELARALERGGNKSLHSAGSQQ